MIVFLDWLLLSLTFIYALAWLFPTITLEICRQLMHWIRSYYAKRHGLVEAETAIPIEPWEARPWEPHWQYTQLASSPPKSFGLWRLVRLHGFTPKYFVLAALLLLQRADFIELEVKEIRKK